MRLSSRILVPGLARSRSATKKKIRIMAEKKQKRCSKLARSEQAATERECGKRRLSARGAARDLGCSPASASDKVRRNDAVAMDLVRAGQGRGGVRGRLRAPQASLSLRLVQAAARPLL